MLWWTFRFHKIRGIWEAEDVLASQERLRSIVNEKTLHSKLLVWTGVSSDLLVLGLPLPNTEGWPTPKRPHTQKGKNLTTIFKIHSRVHKQRSTISDMIRLFGSQLNPDTSLQIRNFKERCAQNCNVRAFNRAMSHWTNYWAPRGWEDRRTPQRSSSQYKVRKCVSQTCGAIFRFLGKTNAWCECAERLGKTQQTSSSSYSRENRVGRTGIALFFL